MPAFLARILLGFAGSLGLHFFGLGTLSYGLSFYSRTRWGVKDGLIVYLASLPALLLPLVFLPPDFGLKVAAFEATIALGMLPALLPWPQSMPDRTLFRIFSAVTVTSVLLLPVWAWFTSDPGWLIEAAEPLQAMLGINLQDSGNIDRELLENTIMNGLNLMSMAYVPAVLNFYLIVIGMSQRFALPPARWPRLQNFKLPSAWIYPFVLGLAGFLWLSRRDPGTPPALWEALWNNLGGVFLIVYTLQGLGIVYHLANKAAGRLGSLFVNLALTGLWLLTIYQGLWQYAGLLIIGVAAFGATETWIRWRQQTDTAERS